MTRQHDATFIPSSFGGGWIVPYSDQGRDWLEAYFNDAPAFLDPIQDSGWIVEPQDMRALAESADAERISILCSQ